MNKQIILASAALASATLCASLNASATGFCSSNPCSSAGTTITGSVTGDVLSVTQTTSNEIAIFGTASGSSGIGVEGIGGKGVYGSGSANGDIGVYGISVSGSAVYGTAGTGTAIHGVLTGSGTAAVHGDGAGYSIGVYGTTSNASAAVKGYNSDTGLPGDGVLGECSYTGCYSIHGTGIIDSDASYFLSGVCYAGPCTSDRSLKQKIEPLKGALDQLVQLKGVTYEWKDTTDRAHPAGTQTGFIAQDVEKVFPGWVAQNDKGFKTVNIPSPMALTAMEVEAFKTLKDRADKADARADKADARADKAEAKSKAQDDRIEALENARRPVSYNPNWGIGVVGLAFAGAFFASRRKREEKSS